MSWYDDPYESAKRWRDRYGLYDFFSYTEDHVKDAEEIINAVRRSANLIVDGQNDQMVSVDWTRMDGTGAQMPKRPNVIYLSPEILKDKGLSRQNLLDILIGTTIIYSYLHRLPAAMHTTLQQVGSRAVATAAIRLMQSFQNYIAQQLIANEYGGYRPYLEAYRKYYTGSELDGTILGKLEKELTSSETHALAPAHREIFDQCKKTVFGTSDEVVRARALIDAVRALYSEQQGDEAKVKADGKKARGGPADPYGECKHPVISPGYTVYDENRVLFKVSHVTPQRAPKRYQEYKTRMGPRIRALRSRLKFRSDQRAIIEHALKSGQIDEGSLYKLGFHQCGVNEDRIFELPMVLSNPDIHVHLLIDESGSMGGTKIKAAAEMAVTIAEAMHGLPGVRLSIWGHSGQGLYHGARADNAAVAEYLNVGDSDLSRLGSIHACAQNIDGAAVKECQKYMVQKSPDAAKLLIVLSDGAPAGNGYGGVPAINHTTEAVSEARRKGIQVISIGVGRFDGSKMYGEANSVVLEGAESIVPVSNIIVSAVNRASMLKEV